MAFRIDGSKITLINGNLLDSKMQTLVNTVNCRGVMGKGLALDFKNQFGDMYKDYVERCANGEVEPGKPYRYNMDQQVSYGVQKSLFGDDSSEELVPTERTIINFPTKHHWKENSKLEYVTDGLEQLELSSKEWNITGIAMPLLGCGNGGLDWQEVIKRIFDSLRRMDVNAEIYLPPAVDEREAAEVLMAPIGSALASI